MSFNLKSALATIAPTLATMLGGPLAGTAVSALEGALGLQSGAGPDAVTKAVAEGLTPDQIAAVRAADQHHAEVMAQQKIDLAKLNADYAEAMAHTDEADRDSARKRQEIVKDATTPWLAWIVVLGSVALGAAVLMGYANTKDATQATLIGTVLGYAFGEAKQVLAFYFGSSSDSQQKNALLAESVPPSSR